MLVANLRSEVRQSRCPVYPRPKAAVGSFLRVVMVNDVYKLANYPPLAELLRNLKAEEAEQGCKVICVLNGDFLSPCIETSLDGGRAMCEVLNKVPVDYVCFGNHEFDIGVKLLQQRTRCFKGTWLNGNISSPEFLGPDGKPLPKYSILQVGERKVCLTGATTDNLDIYRPGSDPEIQAPGKAIAEVAALAQKEAPLFSLPFMSMTCNMNISTYNSISTVYVFDIDVFMYLYSF